MLWTGNSVWTARRLPLATLLVGVLLLPAASPASVINTTTASEEPRWRACNQERQIVSCGDIPVNLRAERLSCCRAHRDDVRPPPAAAAASVAAATTQQATAARTPRADLDGGPGGMYSATLPFELRRCTTARDARVPSFVQAAPDAPTSVVIRSNPVPALPRNLVRRIKAAALAAAPAEVRTMVVSLRTVSAVSGFTHPAGTAGAGELALLAARLRGSGGSDNTPLQAAALNSLLTGAGVRPKVYVNPDGTSWWPPTDCNPESSSYAGPLPMARCLMRWGGLNAANVTCPLKYPKLAPQQQCGHISFVEMDGQMALKAAHAYWATQDMRYAQRVFAIAEAWSKTNVEWGLHWENGPLEAGWGVASMSRALELLRSLAPPGLIAGYVAWVRAVPLPQMRYLSVNLTSKGIPNFYSNWHSAVAEAYVTTGVLADDRALYTEGIALYNATVTDYLKWGKGLTADNRTLGETSETMRDFWHTQFGLGGLLQIAEIAWQQDDELFSRDNYALAAAMELHARIMNAWLANSSAQLPPGFRYFSAMPRAPSGTSWVFSTQRQAWTALSPNGTVILELRDGIRYVLGPGFLPAGWEVGFNHYAGRLGVKMPETAALLARSWPEWQEFSWGLGTLTHAQSAAVLWRKGVTAAAVCASRPATAASTLPAAAAVAAPADAADARAAAGAGGYADASADHGVVVGDKVEHLSFVGADVDGTSSATHAAMDGAVAASGR